MRPIPRQRHVWAVLIIAAIVAGNTALSFLDDSLSDNQANLLCEAYKLRDSAALPSDTVFGPTGHGAFCHLHLPAWQATLGSCLSLAGRLHVADPLRQNPLNAFRLLGGAILLLYLLSMYLLLFRQSRVGSISLVVAALSMAMFNARRPFWGIGPLFAVTPETMYLAMAPLIVLVFVQWRSSWLVAAGFLLAGLWGNIEAASAVNLMLILVLGLVATENFRGGAWARAGVGAAAFGVGIFPAIWHYVTTFRSARITFPPMSQWDVREYLGTGGLNVLYPGLLADLLRLLPIAAVVGVPAAIILTRLGRYRLRDLHLWLWLLLGSTAVALILQGAMQLLAAATHSIPPVIEFFSAIKLAMLPLFVLFAQAMVSLIRLSRTHRFWTQMTVTAFAVVFLASSYNTRPLRAEIQQLIASASPDRATGVATEDDETAALGRWAADTDARSLFLTTQSEIRSIGRRSLLCSSADILYFYHLAPQRLMAWDALVKIQANLLRPPDGSPADAQKILSFVAGVRQAQGNGPVPVYVIIPAQSAPASAAGLSLIEDEKGRWGQHWKLYRARSDGLGSQ